MQCLLNVKISEGQYEKSKKLALFTLLFKSSCFKVIVPIVFVGENINLQPQKLLLNLGFTSIKFSFSSNNFKKNLMFPVVKPPKIALEKEERELQRKNHRKLHAMELLSDAESISNKERLDEYLKKVNRKEVKKVDKKLLKKFKKERMLFGQALKGFIRKINPVNLLPKLNLAGLFNSLSGYKIEKDSHGYKIISTSRITKDVPYSSVERIWSSPSVVICHMGLKPHLECNM